MIVFTPWAFGTTQSWSIRTMNSVALVLGGLLLAKWMIRWRVGFRPPRWQSANHSQPAEEGNRNQRDPLTISLAVLTWLILAYVLVGVFNARADYFRAERRFEYHDAIHWLPHSYDRARSLQMFWMYSGLACFFWATRDWLLGTGGSGRRRHRQKHRHSVSNGGSESTPELASSQDSSGERAEARVPSLAPRLRLLLWVLCLSGSLLALESILQRLSGTNKLLWVLRPVFNQWAEEQFGPYAYRANAASYFNLLWPVSLGFWLILRQAARSRSGGGRIGTDSSMVLLPGAVLMAACPIIATTRGGAIVAALTICAMMALLLWGLRKESPLFRTGVATLFVLIVLFSAVLGYKQLAVRFKTLFTDQMSHRTEIYENATPMAREFPVWGTGPGSFGSLYQLYRTDLNQVWHAYLHDDWLQLRIEFGWVGFSLILLMFGLACARWFWGGGTAVPLAFVGTLWISLGGCLLHAVFDFPMQIYSIDLLFLLLCAILFCSSRPGKPVRL